MKEVKAQDAFRYKHQCYHQSCSHRVKWDRDVRPNALAKVSWVLSLVFVSGGLLYFVESHEVQASTRPATKVFAR